MWLVAPPTVLSYSIRLHGISGSTAIIYPQSIVMPFAELPVTFDHVFHLQAHQWVAQRKAGAAKLRHQTCSPHATMTAPLHFWLSCHRCHCLTSINRVEPQWISPFTVQTCPCTQLEKSCVKNLKVQGKSKMSKSWIPVAQLLTAAQCFRFDGMSPWKSHFSFTSSQSVDTAAPSAE